MLERTAAGLEGGQLQRVICKSATTSRRLHHCRRRLHSSTRRSCLLVKDDNNGQLVAAADAKSAVAASPMLMDFLYPSIGQCSTRIATLNLNQIQKTTKSHYGQTKRLFSSARHVQDASSSDATLRFSDGETIVLSGSESKIASHDEPALHKKSNSKDQSEIQKTKETVRALQDLLSFPIEVKYHEIWDLYQSIPEADQNKYREQVTIYLSKSNSIVEGGRALYLFQHQDETLWTNELVAAGIRAMLVSGNLQMAVDTFEKALKARGFAGGVEHIISNAIQRQDWTVALNTWRKYYEALHAKSHATNDTASSKFNSATIDRTIQFLRPIEEIPDLGRRFLHFEQHLRSTMSLARRSKDALDDFRHKFAEAALLQACPPKEAMEILAIFQEANMYKRYMELMLRRLKDSETTKVSLAQMDTIYRAYRQLPYHQIPRGVLKGMFKLYYPDNVAGLEELYKDWHGSHGELDRWGFEKYMKFYAAKGDVQTVQDLWKRYVVNFPLMLKVPMGFRSIMNVYAQVGDVEAAEIQLKKMETEYKVKPDLSTWNALLKCYMRAEDYNKTMACFDDICTRFTPDTFTFAHAMAMSAKKGDVDKTLELFNKSQAMRVKISKEMSMGLIMTYLRSGRIKDAEQICMALASRGATSSLVWNELIYHNGLQGNIAKCQELLQAMKKAGVAWDHQTHEFLLQALVKVNQIQAAFQLLRSAYRDGLFPVRADHFAIVIAGATRAGETALLEPLEAAMRAAGFRTSFNAQVSLAEAAYTKNPTAQRTRVLAADMVTALREQPATSNPAELKQLTRFIGRAAHILIQLREFEHAESLVTVYTSLFPSPTLPPNLVAALMQAYLRDNRHADLLALWTRHYDTLYATNKRPDSPTIFPGPRYSLSRPITILARSLRAQRDGTTLLSIVSRATDAGFRFTRPAANTLVQALADLNQWHAAMAMCEATLMPGWRGWSPGPSSSSGKLLTNVRYLVPWRETVLALQRNWLRLRRLAAWSASVSADFNDTERKYPLLHQAFMDTDYENLPVQWSGGGGAADTLARAMSMNKVAKEALQGLELAELVEMRRVLEKELRLLDRKKKARKATERTVT
ncbi:hypothetical protein VHEMI04621 [[Torrubiella] hemipterigena]|uniref:Uncharacterized protein n=1 Tax=[Torrubiella] hemipterigena TaxID=1531966 RepID=A0A0A1T1T3_9HYPO|nr:hypothetical protein VHEMI04621 [[Torrubiella] hemipterigena]